ncbi:amidohydrolase family protein [uncultured Psychrobacter sp.]|uniref:amidohydrolase family protein n=1 Tax=uncultured Psychrobacter sp. TaxID=259303 RepID=UPI00261BE4F6|nr:amidohydrolase family protein [uncultured Psychrobacter sp.]
MTDLTIKNARLMDYQYPVDIHIKDGHIASIDVIKDDITDNESDKKSKTSKNVYDAKDNFVCSGFFESHIHLDKACILDRCSVQEGTLKEAVEETGKAKEDFTEQDVFERASRVIEMAIKKGTVGLRTFVETDEKTELRSFEAIKRAQDRYAFVINIEICAFAQSGLTTKPKTHELLQQALEQGADLIGGCPYKDENPDQHIEMIFDIAEQFDVDVDFHLDFDLDPQGSSIPKVVEETIKRGYQGRVSIGHVTKLSAMDKMKRGEMAGLLKQADITLIVLPATDIYINGSNYEALIPRGTVNANQFAALGLNTTISSNNILNAFTPYGDASLIRMANMYANIAQLSTDDELTDTFDMITKNAAKLLATKSNITVGAPATLVILEAKNAVEAIRINAQALAGFKNGKQTFCNEAAHICFE